jgi:galactose-1-phosphate uridylyltransferase
VSDGAQNVIVRMPDGTVKQVGPLTGTRVWTVPGRAHRPLAAPRDPARPLRPGQERSLCAFCVDRYLETTPEKARLVGADFTELRRVPAAEVDDTVAEFRRFGNLFEIVSAEYWRENHGFRQPASIIEWAQQYLSEPIGRAHLEKLAAIRAAASGVEQSLEEATLDLLGGSHDVIVARRHVADDAVDDDELVSSGELSAQEHAAYFAFTVRSLAEIQESQPHAAYVAVFQNWLRPAGASFEHLHKQLVAIDEHGPQVDRELRMLASDHALYQHRIADLAVEQDLIVAAVDGAVAFAGVGHRYPAFEVFSTSESNLPQEHSDTEVRAMSDLVHALHAATGVHVPTNEEWHYRPPGAPWPMPWRVVLKWRISNPAGFEGGTKVYVNTIDPWELRRRAVDALRELRAAGRISGDIRIGDECEPGDARLRYHLPTRRGPEDGDA